MADCTRLHPDDLAAIADLIADRVCTRLSVNAEWLDSNRAAQYLGVSRKAIYHYVERRGLPAHQDQDGGKLWFKRSELDDWRMS